MALTDAQKVRLLTGLTTGELDDDDITGFLEVNDGSVKAAAADALEMLAGTLITAVSSDDISLDGSKRATVLMARAKGLREQAAADEADDDFSFEVVPGYTGRRPELTERSCW